MKKVWKVQEDDITSVGGPMGTEDVRTLKESLFTTRSKAVKYLQKVLLEKEATNVPTEKIKDGYYLDCGAIGYSLTAITIK